MTKEEKNSQKEMIFVDLDGTLIRSDIFAELVLVFVKKNPLNLFRLIFWLSKGRSIAKTLIARHAELDVSILPYEAELVEYLKLKRQQGHRIILATACHWFYANKVAAHLGLFDEVIATCAKQNLKGTAKLQKIEERTKGAPFAYAGDSAADRPIWRAAHSCIHVNSSKSDVARSVSENKLAKSIQSRPSTFRAFVRTMRIHQYLKNILIFVPLFTSHSYGDAASVLSVSLAFFCFSLCASGVYFLNDLLDLSADRQHATKCNRPLASGALSIFVGVVGALSLPTIAFAIAAYLLPIDFIMVLIVYFVITNAYSFYIKGSSTADVMTLAVLYTIRVVAGGAVVAIGPSSWLLAFSVFIFVGLAFLKRYIEVSRLDGGEEHAKGRSYTYNDRESLFVLGSINSIASVLVLSLYINSPAVSIYYSNPQVLWSLCLLMLYWTNRLWVEARRGRIHEDPVIFAIKDSVSRWILLTFIVVILVARIF